MFSFPEDAPTARRLAQNWNTATCPLLDQQRDSAGMEYERLPPQVRSGPVYIESTGQRGMASTPARISNVRRHSTNFGDGRDSRRARFSDGEGLGERSYEISPGGRLTSGKHTPPAIQLTLRAVAGFWTFIAATRLDGRFRLEECLPPFTDSRQGSTLLTVQNRRRTVSMCRPSVWACIKSAPFHPLDLTDHSFFTDPRTEYRRIFDFSIGMACRQYGTGGILSPICPWDPGGDPGLPRRLLRCWTFHN